MFFRKELKSLEQLTLLLGERITDMNKRLDQLETSMLNMTDVIDMAREYEARLADCEGQLEVVQWNSVPKHVAEGFNYPAATVTVLDRKPLDHES